MTVEEMRRDNSMTEPCDLSAVEARDLIGERKLSPVELLESCIARIEKTNTAVNSMVATDLDAARKRAKEIELSIGRGEDAGLLAGLPIGVKDLQATAGLRTTLGSPQYKDNVPADDECNVACPAGRRRRDRQDQHARVRRRRQHRQPGLRRDRQSVRPGKDLRRLLGRLGGGAGDRHGAARDRLRHGRQPAQRRRRSAASSASGPARARAARLRPVGWYAPQRAGPDGRAPWPTRPAVASAMGAATSATRFLPARRTRTSEAIDLGQPARRRSARTSAAPRSTTHRRSVQGRASGAFADVFRRCGRRAPAASDRCTTFSRCTARAASWRRTASACRRIARTARPQRHRQRRAGLDMTLLDDVSRAHVDADQALQALPGLLQGRATR